ncbi:MAG: transcriptional regulator [Eubacteriales bacterium]|nr:transcriptional regulator [Eubacteriales bacterium]
MIKLTQKTSDEIDRELALRFQSIRKRKKISRKLLSERSGVSLGSLRRFEESGEISLKSLTKLTIAMEISDELEELFTDVPFASIEEVLNGQSR